MPFLKKIFSSLKKLFIKKKTKPLRKRNKKKSAPPKNKSKARTIKRRPAPSRSAPKKKPSLPVSKPLSSVKTATKAHSPGEFIGEITHFFTRIQVIVVKLKGPLQAGDKIRIQGKSVDFTQTVRSMQIESVDVRAARRGQLIGLKVESPVSVGDKVYKLP